MQMDLEYGMRAVSVVWHPSSSICSARAEAVASRRGLEPTQTVTVTSEGEAIKETIKTIFGQEDGQACANDLFGSKTDCARHHWPERIFFWTARLPWGKRHPHAGRQADLKQ
jgi:hypothetical protein